MAANRVPGQLGLLVRPWLKKTKENQDELFEFFFFFFANARQVSSRVC